MFRRRWKNDDIQRFRNLVLIIVKFFLNLPTNISIFLRLWVQDRKEVIIHYFSGFLVSNLLFIKDIKGKQINYLKVLVNPITRVYSNKALTI